jgi:hypothetical protein
MISFSGVLEGRMLTASNAINRHQISGFVITQNTNGIINVCGVIVILM